MCDLRAYSSEMSRKNIGNDGNAPFSFMSASSVKYFGLSSEPWAL